MNRSIKGSDWSSHAVEFLSHNLPRINAKYGDGWEHMSATAYQIGCAALVALGQAEETRWGAAPLKDPRLPDVLPRWDDVCVATLCLAAQRGTLIYCLPDGSVPQPISGWTIVHRPGTCPPEPNIAAANSLGQAYAAPETLAVLHALGIVAEGSWTDAAETLLWRYQPAEWSMDISSDARFLDAVKQTVDTVPDDIRAKIDRLVTITEADIAAAKAQSLATYKEARAEFGPKALIAPPLTAEQAQNMLVSKSKDELDWLFFRRWRLPDGWLTHKNSKRALEIFHDPLAIAMRQAVLRLLHPSLAEFSKSKSS